MLNRLRADLYRLFHSVAIYVLPVITIFSTIAGFIARMIRQNPLRESCTIYDIFGEALSSGLPLLAVSCVLTSFYASEYRNGYIKNIAGNIKNRFQLPLSKMIVGFVTFLITYFFMLFDMVCGLIINQGKITTDVSVHFAFSEHPVRDWVIWYIIMLLVYLMVSALICFIVELTHSSAAGYVISVLISLNVLGQLVLELISILQNSFGLFKMLDGNKPFILTPVSTTLNYMCSDTSLFLPLAVCTSVLLALFFGLTIFMVKKRDIK